VCRDLHFDSCSFLVVVVVVFYFIFAGVGRLNSKGSFWNICELSFGGFFS
jgi:hypothetical protein